jgi:hypothetical protein
MTRSRFDTDRVALARIVAGRDRYEEKWRQYNEVADRILIDWLPGYTERVKAEALRDAAEAWDQEFARGKVLTPFAASWLRDRAGRES